MESRGFTGLGVGLNFARSPRMMRWWLATALVALSLAGCDMPLEGLRDPSGVDAAGSTDAAEPDAYISSPPHVDSGAATAPDASHAVLKDGSGDGNDAHAIEAGAKESGTRAEAGDEAGDDD
jgi:hypothetical protein